MKLNGGSVDVTAGSGTTNNPAHPFIPVVRSTVRGIGASGEPAEIRLHLTPEKARRIGLDFIAAANMAWSDSAIRIYAKQHGADGDSIIGQVKALVDIAMENET